MLCEVDSFKEAEGRVGRLREIGVYTRFIVDADFALVTQGSLLSRCTYLHIPSPPSFVWPEEEMPDWSQNTEKFEDFHEVPGALRQADRPTGPQAFVEDFMATALSQDFKKVMEDAERDQANVLHNVLHIFGGLHLDFRNFCNCTNCMTDFFLFVFSFQTLYL